MARLGREATQNEFLYDDRWTKEVENLFIDLLVEAHFGLEWRHGRPGSHVFAYCRGVFAYCRNTNLQRSRSPPVNFLPLLHLTHRSSLTFFCGPKTTMLYNVACCNYLVTQANNVVLGLRLL
ncbi:glyoxalase/bleomycin resistanceprotein/dioxygenase [Striga asiatica]|uniref:Glyoxalase/bleomycin resistanceprotein/dioxygenase n=1 Tax=Striga asiatica TaxID=4170 RepID=A0A5A7Q8J4_STRAF|nr:glyoxalase/bleomycin resistanceprotein/dioxygenase [Striga asiatica]